ncbi:hypothetical protein [Salinifilum ghardaiensis]
MQDMAIAAREEAGGSGSVVDDLLAERRAEAAEGSAGECAGTRPR